MDIRKIIDFITEAQKPLAKGMQVMSPEEFLISQGIDVKSSDEIKEAGKLPVDNVRKVPDEEMVKYLDRVVGEPVLDKTGKPKLDKKGNPVYKSLKTKTDKYKYPYIHRSNVPIVNQEGKNMILINWLLCSVNVQLKY